MLRILGISLCAISLFGMGFGVGVLKTHREMAGMVTTEFAISRIHDVEQHSIEQIHNLEKTCIAAIDMVKAAK